MLVHEEYALDPDGACRLIAAHGWATIVTAGPTGIRATYGFCLLEPEDGQGITVLGHIARADPQAADLIAGASTLLIFNGPHGYVSASWYRPTMTQVPSTWNYTAVHLRGTPVMLTGDEAFEVLRRTLDRHEALLPEGERWTPQDRARNGGVSAHEPRY
jgi:transcriptional regulator